MIRFFNFPFVIILFSILFFNCSMPTRMLVTPNYPEMLRGIPYKTNLLNQLKVQLSNTINKVDQNNLNVEKLADGYVENLYGNKEKADPKDVETARESYIKPLTMEIIDPNQSQKTITELENEINEFNAKIDSSISVANAINNIEVEY